MPSVSNKDVCECGNWKGTRKRFCKSCLLDYVVERALTIKATLKPRAGKPSNAKIHAGESGYIGVYASTHNDSWTGAVQVNGHRASIGHWDTPREAHKARLAIYLAVYGEYPVDRGALRSEYAKDDGDVYGDTPLERAHNFIDSAWMKAIID